MVTLEDIKFMNLALKEAYRAKGSTLPNPAVGAVLVKNGEVISKGFHRKAGTPHAEALAIERAGEKAKGSTLYVTLEPCNHYGRTPPCTERIIKAGIKEVVVGIRDPNPVASGGVERLRRKGIKVKVGVLKKRCFELIDDFTVNVKEKRAFLHLKLASTLDGKLADEKGNSKWITSKVSREKVQVLRSRHNAVMVGIGTVLKDNPRLTVRSFPVEKQPLAIVVDRNLRIPTNSYLVKERAKELIVITSQESLLSYKAGILRDFGVRLLPAYDLGGKLDLKGALQTLMEEFKVYSVLCEGGAGLASSLLFQNLVDKLTVFYSPKVVGKGLSLFSGISLPLKKAKELKLFSLKKIRRDFTVTLYREELEKWWAREDSNLRPSGYEPDALTN
jgi:diaminohydroxyphosphoribosylaminopyrimidine deaminase/5-amino-6-(5-phosphoribosylamino)uracil reductase